MRTKWWVGLRLPTDYLTGRCFVCVLNVTQKKGRQMPTWNGKPPEGGGGGGGGMLPPGTYTATIHEVKGTTGFDGEQLEINWIVEGKGKIRQWITADIGNPKNKGAWIFWKLVGSLDYPTQEYWETPAGEREAREWNPLQDLRDCSDSGRTILLVVEQYEKKSGGTGTRVASSKLASPRRNPGISTGPEEPVEPKGFVSKDDVPF